jgi:hypothetical protein
MPSSTDAIDEVEMRQIVAGLVLAHAGFFGGEPCQLTEMTSLLLQRALAGEPTRLYAVACYAIAAKFMCGDALPLRRIRQLFSGKCRWLARSTVRLAEVRILRQIDWGLYRLYEETRRRFDARLPQGVGIRLPALDPAAGRCVQDANSGE